MPAELPSPAPVFTGTESENAMEFYIPNFVSYEMLLQCVCARAVAGKTADEIAYMVELAEELCRLMRDLDHRMRAQ